MKVCASEDVKLPTKQALEKKVAQMQKLVSQPMTEVCGPLPIVNDMTNEVAE